MKETVIHSLIDTILKSFCLADIFPFYLLPLSEKWRKDKGIAHSSSKNKQTRNPAD